MTTIHKGDLAAKPGEVYEYTEIIGYLSSALEWRPVLDGKYEVSRDGRVRTGFVSGNNNSHHIGKLKSIHKAKNGYLTVTVSRGGKQGAALVHCLVAEAFIGQRPSGFQVNHKDGIKTNNHADNLEYLSGADNIAHAIRTGHWRWGEKLHNAKLTADKVVTMRKEYGTGKFSYSDLAKKYDVNQATVGKIINRDRWRHV